VTLLFDIAWTHIRGRLRQTIVSTVGVMLGVGFSIAMAGLMQGSQDDFVATLIDALPHVLITDEVRVPPQQPATRIYDAVAISGLQPKDDRRGILNPTAVIAGLRAWVPGTYSASLSGQGVIRYFGKELGIVLTGVDPKAELAVSSIEDDFREGSLEALVATANGIVIGDTLAGKLGAEFGNTFSITSASGVLKQFKIVGLFHTGISASDEGTGLVNLKSAQILFERPNAISQIKVHLDDIDVADIVAARIEAETGYKAVAWEEANEGLLEAFQIRNTIMYTVVGAILLVAGFGIFNIVSTIVHEKARDIAILRSLGFRQHTVMQIFVLEGLSIGVFGSLAGSALGYWLCRLLASIKFEIKGGPAEITHLPIAYEPVHYAIAVGLALASAGVAAYMPARTAARLNPVDIIRGAT
jgi:lipoprotein-releasing system permease protein